MIIIFNFLNVSERVPEQLGAVIESQDAQVTKEALQKAKDQMQLGTGGMMEMFSKLFDSKEGGKYTSLMGAIMAIVKMVFGIEDKKEDNGSDVEVVTSNNLSDVDAEKPEENPVQAESNELASEDIEKFNANNVFYVGDSYMVGIRSVGVNGGKINPRNVNAKVSRPMLPMGSWSGDNIADLAMESMKNTNCKLLVLNGGLNDFYMSGNPEKTGEKLIESYRKILNEANSRGIKVIIYDIPKIPKSNPKKDRIYTQTDAVNDWFSKQGARTIDTDNVVAGDYDKQGMHPRDYNELFDQVGNSII